MKEHLRPALTILGLLTLITGILYPLLVTGLAQGIFPRRAGGSLLVRGAHPVGSALIGQPFSDPRWFWGRPSATSPFPYNAAASTGSNLGPTNPALVDTVKARIAALRAADPGNSAPVPADLVTASGSGLDPDISVSAAMYQVPRVARSRGFSEQAVRQLVQRHIQPRQLGLLGEPRVNVLELNLALEDLH
jgi:K+-transporting ATPase ATPase C chain